MSTTVVLTRRAALAPVAWVLGSGWLDSDVRALPVEDDAAVMRALTQGDASLALIEPASWARNRTEVRIIPRVAVTLGPGGTDALLLGAVRLDELERVTGPVEIGGTAEEAVARSLVRDYYGILAPVVLQESGMIEGEEGRIVSGNTAMAAQDAPYAESLSRAWWIASGMPWVRALALEAATDEPDPNAEALFKEIGRLLREQGETVASGLCREHGGEEERWRHLVDAVGLDYGLDERKGLAALLAHAARLRLCPRLEETLLPRY
ncbi:MAG: hypothetical protein M3506_10110 [Chloroflexota bacterium]|nr:hypothetical protein [Chloroflexota bacterium]